MSRKIDDVDIEEDYEPYKHDNIDPTLGVMMFLQATVIATGPATSAIFGQWQFGAAVATALTAGLWKVSLTEIKTAPKHVGILKLRGKPILVLKHRGWRLVPLKGFFLAFDVVPVDVTAEELEITKEDNLVLTTPVDRIQSPPVSIAVTWRPDDSCADALTRYLDYSKGGKKKSEISDFLKELVEERARQYANSPVEGPKTIEELVNSTSGLTHAIMKKLSGKELNKIESRVPTEVLLEWFNYPAGPMRESFGVWGKKWEKVEEILKTEDRAKVHKQVKERDKQMRAAMDGRAEIHMRWLGIIIEKIAVSEIEEPSELAKARLLKKQADEQNKADQARLDALRLRIAMLMGVKPEEVKLTREEAVPMVATGGKMGVWEKREERRSFDVGSTLGEILKNLGLKVNIESATDGGRGKGTK